MATYSDNFDRANEGVLASPWAAAGEANPMELSSQHVIVPNYGQDCGSRLTGTSFTGDQGASCKVTVAGTTAGSGFGVFIRHVDSTTRTGYRIVASKAASANVEIGRFVNGSFTSLATITTTWVDGDLLAVEVTGPTNNAVIVVKQNGNQIGTTTDTANTVPASKILGLAYSETATSGFVDDFDAYDVTTAVWPPEGSEDAPQKLRVVRSGVTFS